ncbi:MAG TPA: DUF4387 domain-containing protein [Usitatibacteraceae bacterium]
MKTLFELCSLIRSKNAGPFVLTFDFMLSSQENYAYVKRAQPLHAKLVSKLYDVPPEKITVVYHDSAMAIKVSMPRPVFQCDPGDNDCYGGQQYVPLLDLPVDAGPPT